MSAGARTVVTGVVPGVVGVGVTGVVGVGVGVGVVDAAATTDVVVPFVLFPAAFVQRT